MDNKYVAQFDELKTFVKTQAGDTAIKLMKLKDEASKKNLMAQRLTKIREKIDQMTQDLGIGQIGPQLGKDHNQDQQRQLQQVKQTLTSFLQQAGKQMKSSEEDLSTVIKIINLDEDLMQQSTNSLIIKLWNTILTSVGEFKKTYQTNQLEVTQKLDVMDVKLDAIMDRIESGQNEMLLELYKMSKVQDMLLDKPQECKSSMNSLDINIWKDIQFQKTFQMEIQPQLQNKLASDQQQQQKCPNCATSVSSLNISKEESKSTNLSLNGKYSEKIMKALQEKAHANAYERIQMRRQQETEWRYIQYDHIAYEGEFLKGTDTEYGLAITINNNGNVYEGSCKNNKAHGYGEYYWKDGNYYQGQFSEGKRNGYGVYYYNSGSKYQGEQNDDKRHGLGILHYPNKDILIGQWIDDKQHGQHVKITTNNDIYQFTLEMGKLIKDKKLT